MQQSLGLGCRHHAGRTYRRRTGDRGPRACGARRQDRTGIVAVLNWIYEDEFLGFSYGFRQGGLSIVLLSQLNPSKDAYRLARDRTSKTHLLLLHGTCRFFRRCMFFTQNLSLNGSSTKMTPPGTFDGHRQACRLGAFEIQSLTRDQPLKDLPCEQKRAPEGVPYLPSEEQLLCDN
jgi:hypothetical protein